MIAERMQRAIRETHMRGEIPHVMILTDTDLDALKNLASSWGLWGTETVSAAQPVRYMGVYIDGGAKTLLNSVIVSSGALEGVLTRGI